MYPNPNIDTANETTEYTEIGLYPNPDPDIKPTERASYVARPKVEIRREIAEKAPADDPNKKYFNVFHKQPLGRPVSFNDLTISEEDEGMGLNADPIKLKLQRMLQRNRRNAASHGFGGF